MPVLSNTKPRPEPSGRGIFYGLSLWPIQSPDENRPLTPKCSLRTLEIFSAKGIDKFGLFW